VVLPAAGGVLAAEVEAVLGALLASLAGVFAPPAFGSVGLASVCAAGVSLTFLGLPKSSTVVSGKICVTIPAAIVLPPSLSANLEPLSMVMGKLSLALMVKLSPGLAILTP